MSIAHGLLKLYFQIAQFSERFITDNKREVFNWYAKKDALLYMNTIFRNRFT